MRLVDVDGESRLVFPVGGQCKASISSRVRARFVLWAGTRRGESEIDMCMTKLGAWIPVVDSTSHLANFCATCGLASLTTLKARVTSPPKLLSRYMSSSSHN